MNQIKSSKLRRLKKVGTSQRIESSEDEENVFNQGRISVDIDEGMELEMDQEKDVAAASTPISASKPAVKPKVLFKETNQFFRLYRKEKLRKW
nr:hypothetical protein [Tanacetum cinerariifolium]